MMKKLALTLVFGILGVGVYGQTIKSLGYNTTNGQVVYSGTNLLEFADNVQFQNVWARGNFAVRSGTNDPIVYIGDDLIETSVPIEFLTNAASLTRTNLGLGWSALTNTNASNFRNAIDLGTNDSPRFGAVNVIDTIFSFGQTLISGGSISVNNSNSQGVSMNPAGYTAGSINIVSGVGGNTNAITFSAAAAAATRTNLGIGNGITTNRTFVSYNGTNYTTNSVTISNGIITGWTQ
jgi:hypothetical protein